MPTKRLVPALILVVCFAATYFYSRSGLGLLNDLLEGEQIGPLELPPELVMGHVSPPWDWGPDPTGNGLLMLPMQRDVFFGPAPVTERLERPWKDRVVVPCPEDYFTVGGPSRDGRFCARPDRSKGGPGVMIITARPTGEVAARLEPFALPQSRKYAVWHPTSNVLVTGGYGQVTLLSEPDWRPKTLATAARDQAEWLRRSQLGQEESGFHPNENVSQLAFSDDGELLLGAMDRGLRVYPWKEVLRATDRLPAPRAAVDGELVPIGSFMIMRMTYAVAYDAPRKRVLWGGLGGTLAYLDVETQAQGMLLALPKGYLISRLQLLDNGQVLGCEIGRRGRSTWPSEGVFLLDYPRLVARGKVIP
jgi:hypothetical protein